MKSLRSALVPLALALLFVFTPSGSASAQDQMSAEDEAVMKQMMQNMLDPEAAEATRAKADESRRWTAGSGIVHYSIVGEYRGQPNVVGDGNWAGVADVTDRVAIQLDWKLSEAKLVGTPVIQNTKSTVKNPRNFEPKCLPPILKGAYEHYELLSVKEGLAGQLEFQVRTSYPVVEVAQFCTGSRTTIPASTRVRPEEFTVVTPLFLTTPLPDSDALRVSADKKSLIATGKGWTWTYTPSVKK